MQPSNHTPPRRTLCIGLVGFGTVGKGLFDVLEATRGLQATIKKICIKDPGKKRAVDSSYFTTDFNELLNDECINVIAELIDDADAAFEMVRASLQKGKAVVSANKKMIAAHLPELLRLQSKCNTAFLYEASCCAGIPIIRNLEEYYDNDMLTRLRGIVNGSTNFILTKIAEENLSFKKALGLAQEAGFAESDPSLDIEGHDAANKLSILAAHAFGIAVPPQKILYTGITAISERDAAFAAGKDCSIKLLAYAQKNTGGSVLFVLPQLVKKGSDFDNVKNEFNALETESCFADRHFFKGKGAGAYPTAAAVLSDIAALRYDYRYEYKKMHTAAAPVITNDFLLNISVSADDIQKLKTDAFAHIDHLHREAGNPRITGSISAKQLAANSWWKENNVSLLLCEKAFPEKKISPSAEIPEYSAVYERATG